MCLDSSRARYRGNHGEIAVYGNKIGDFMAELVNRENGIDEIMAEIAAATGWRSFQDFVSLREGGKGGRLALSGANQKGLSVDAGVRG